MPDSNLVTLLALGAFLVLGGLVDIGWRRRTGTDGSDEHL
jgi:hypothetical protein